MKPILEEAIVVPWISNRQSSSFRKMLESYHDLATMMARPRISPLPGGALVTCAYNWVWRKEVAWTVTSSAS